MCSCNLIFELKCQSVGRDCHSSTQVKLTARTLRLVMVAEQSVNGRR